MDGRRTSLGRYRSPIGLIGILGTGRAQAQITDDGLLHAAIGAPDALHLSRASARGSKPLTTNIAKMPSTEQVLALQTTIFAEYDTGPFQIGAEFHDARAYFQRRNSSVGTDVVNALEFSLYDLRGDLGEALGASSDSHSRSAG